MEIRLSEAHKERLNQARRLGGYPSLSAFFLAAAEEKVNKILQEKLPMLPLDEQSVFQLLEMIQNPAPANEALRELMKTDLTHIVEKLLHSDKDQSPRAPFTATPAKKPSKKRISLR